MKGETQMNKKLTAYDLGKRLKVSHTTIYRWVEMGMPHEKVSSGLRSILRFNIKEVRAWLKDKRI